jgi:hypothetical protein
MFIASPKYTLAFFGREEKWSAFLLPAERLK